MTDADSPLTAKAPPARHHVGAVAACVLQRWQRSADAGDQAQARCDATGRAWACCSKPPLPASLPGCQRRYRHRWPWWARPTVAAAAKCSSAPSCAGGRVPACPGAWGAAGPGIYAVANVYGLVTRLVSRCRYRPNIFQSRIEHPKPSRLRPEVARGEPARFARGSAPPLPQAGLGPELLSTLMNLTLMTAAQPGSPTL